MNNFIRILYECHTTSISPIPPSANNMIGLTETKTSCPKGMDFPKRLILGSLDGWATVSLAWFQNC